MAGNFPAFFIDKFSNIRYNILERNKKGMFRLAKRDSASVEKVCKTLTDDMINRYQSMLDTAKVISTIANNIQQESNKQEMSLDVEDNDDSIEKYNNFVGIYTNSHPDIDPIFSFKLGFYSGFIKKCEVNGKFKKEKYSEADKINIENILNLGDVFLKYCNVHKIEILEWMSQYLKNYVTDEKNAIIARLNREKEQFEQLGKENNTNV